MKKKIVLRALLGFPLGIAIGHCISLLASAILGRGTFEVCMPAFIETVGTELGAVALQTLLCGVIGAASAASSLVWETDWGILRQTGIYFLILAGAMLPIAYITGWMEHSLMGFLKYFLVFVLIFAIIWVIQYLAWKGKLKRLNERMKEI